MALSLRYQFATSQQSDTRCHQAIHDARRPHFLQAVFRGVAGAFSNKFGPRVSVTPSLSHLNESGAGVSHLTSNFHTRSRAVKTTAERRRQMRQTFHSWGHANAKRSAMPFSSAKREYGLFGDAEFEKCLPWDLVLYNPRNTSSDSDMGVCRSCSYLYLDQLTNLYHRRHTQLQLEPG